MADLFKRIGYKFTRYRHENVESPVVIIRDGKTTYSNFKKQNFINGSLDKALKDKGLQSIEEVELGILETDGKISIIPMKNRNWRVVQDLKKSA